MNFTFIREGPALLVENESTSLVIADLHFGIESEFSRRGIHIPSRSCERGERAIRCAKETHPDRIILLGDVKHNVPLTSKQEYYELPRILDNFRAIATLRILPGNHDSGLERFLNPEEILPARGACIDGVGYLHGHTLPDPALLGGLIILGHLHPIVALYDEVGCALRDAAYIAADLNEACLLGKATVPGRTTRLLFMPAFNELSGYDLRSLAQSGPGPFSRCMNKDTAEIFLADGTYVGTFDSLASPPGA
ncbi:MAG: metallophosphoesterase [Methanomicrobiales archaeon]|nr:metallophosphoesterase [Methanomicrobiales archaeon]